MPSKPWQPPLVCVHIIGGHSVENTGGFYSVRIGEVNYHYLVTFDYINYITSDLTTSLDGWLMKKPDS